MTIRGNRAEGSVSPICVDGVVIWSLVHSVDYCSTMSGYGISRPFSPKEPGVFKGFSFLFVRFKCFTHRSANHIYISFFCCNIQKGQG